MFRFVIKTKFSQALFIFILCVFKMICNDLVRFVQLELLKIKPAHLIVSNKRNIRNVQEFAFARISDFLFV